MSNSRHIPNPSLNILWKEVTFLNFHQLHVPVMLNMYTEVNLLLLFEECSLFPRGKIFPAFIYEERNAKQEINIGALLKQITIFLLNVALLIKSVVCFIMKMCSLEAP